MMDFAQTKALFQIPENIIYLDGNSLGPPPKSANGRIEHTVRVEWGEMLIRAWNEAGWMVQPGRIGDRIARLLGAPSGTVVVGDTLSIKVYQALAAAIALRPGRKVVLSDSGNFPTDLYMADGLIAFLDRGMKLKIVGPDEVISAIDENVAVVMLTHVDYRTGRMHDMDSLTRKAHERGAVIVWDLAHSAGAVPMDLGSSRADYAVGCTYKYLNGGPGAPAFIYVRKDLIAATRPVLSGWMGHAAPFEFALDYRPSDGVERLRVGTPPVLQMVALEAALDLWDGVDMNAIRRQSIELSQRFIRGCETRCPQLELVSPRDPAKRGSQVSFAFEEGYATIRALISRGVIGDFRAPNIMRFGFTPLYLDEDDVDEAVAILADVLSEQVWQRPEFQVRTTVT